MSGSDDTSPILAGENVASAMPEHPPAVLRLGPENVATRCEDCRGHGGRRRKGSHHPCRACDGVGYVGADPHGAVSLPGQDRSLGHLILFVYRAARHRAGLSIYPSEGVSE